VSRGRAEAAIVRGRSQWSGARCDR
jgi:hypothetical protein